jgi:hypothetical protein
MLLLSSKENQFKIMKNLISMTNFVLEQNSTEGKSLTSTDWLKEFELRFIKIVKYAEFLKKPASIGMFVPCDLNGNVLENFSTHFPTGNNELEETIFAKNKEYQEAEERVLFKNFQVVNLPIKQGLYSKSIADGSGLIHLFWYSKVTEIWSLSHGLNTIEDLAIFNSIELTQTALKKISLPNNESNA